METPQKFHTNVISPVVMLLYVVYVLISLDDNPFSVDHLVSLDYSHYAIILCLAILVHPLEHIIKGGIKQTLRADVLLTTSFIYWTLLDVVQSRYPLIDVSIAGVKYTFIYIALFVFFIQIFSNYRLALPKLIKDASKVQLSTKTLMIIVVVCFLIGMFPFYRGSYYDFSYMMEALTRPRFAAPWLRGGSLGGFSAIFEHMKYFGYLLPALAAILYVKEGRLNPKVILALFLAVFFSAFEFQGGGRRLTGFLAGVGMVTFLVAKRDQLKVKHFAFMGVAAVALLILMDMQLTFRNMGYAGMFQKYDYESFTEIKVDDNFLRIAQVLDNVPEVHPYSGTQYLFWAFARPVPRVFWPGKPVSPGFNVAAMVGERGVTLTTTVVGEAYASFGIIMIIFIAFLYGILAGTLTRMLNQNLGIVGIALYSLGTLALVGGVRSLVDLIIYSYAFLGLLVIYYYVIRGKEEKFA